MITHRLCQTFSWRQNTFGFIRENTYQACRLITKSSIVCVCHHSNRAILTVLMKWVCVCVCVCSVLDLRATLTFSSKHTHTHMTGNCNVICAALHSSVCGIVAYAFVFTLTVQYYNLYISATHHLSHQRPSVCISEPFPELFSLAF